MYIRSAAPANRKARVRRVRVTHYFAANDDVAVESVRVRAPGAPLPRYGERAVDVGVLIGGGIVVAVLGLSSILVAALLSGVGFV
jgi:hypothetical protein